MFRRATTPSSPTPRSTTRTRTSWPPASICCTWTPRMYANANILGVQVQQMLAGGQDVRVRVVLLGVGDDGVVALLNIRGALHANQHASGLGLVQNLRRH